MNILLTGATGNIGLEVLNQFILQPYSGKIIAGVRDVVKARSKYSEFENIELRKFDFEDTETFDSALVNIDIVFLLRPPQISNIQKYIEPLINKIAAIGNIKVVLLSVQGAEKSSIIPHRKIELLILKNKIAKTCQPKLRSTVLAVSGGRLSEESLKNIRICRLLQ